MIICSYMLIWLIHQQFLCHGGWALRTPAATSGASTMAKRTTSTAEFKPPPPQSPSMPLVSSSEATLLTSSRIFSAQMQRLHAPNNHDDHIDTSKYDQTSGGGGGDITPESASDVHRRSRVTAKNLSPPKNKNNIVSVKTNCTRDLFEMRIDLGKKFRGVLYAKDFPFECRTRGSSSMNVTLKLPTSGCGVRSESHTNGELELSVNVMLQMDEKLRQSTDILRTIRCVLPQNAMGMHFQAGGGVRKTFRNGRMRLVNSADDDVNAPAATPPSSSATTFVPQSSKSTPRVRIWLELGGPDGSGAVEVGQATTLTVRAVVPGTMGVRVVDCAALDGLGDSTQQLLDQRGCPIDEQVMPALHTRFKPAEEGWSKNHEDDLVEKLFTATFPAFKFPDRERLHVSCGVQLCKGTCPNVNCRKGEQLIFPSDKHLARIEVFNSLAVTAPQIEVDRLRYDRRYNMSVEEYPPRIRPIPSEGTLCLSISKLAISFCVLGLIFLVAIIVSICCLIRSRRRNPSRSGTTTTTAGSRTNRGEISTSMFSSSSESAQSARFGSKLFIPYYPGSLPYGRVY